MNPKQRYKLSGQYDKDSYETDLERFPDYFDSNGWPLFGEDRDALDHPITGLPWYEAPRVPSIRDRDGDYPLWFHFAEALMSAIILLMTASRALRRKPYTKGDILAGAIYLGAPDRKLLDAHSTSLRALLPRLEKLLYSRVATTQFATHWGAFCILEHSVAEVLARLNKATIGGSAGGKNHKNAQLKWYALWRQHYERKGLRLSQAKSDLVKVAFYIARGKIAPPDRFDQAWFCKVLGQDGMHKKGEPAPRPVQELSDTLSRSLKTRNRDEIIADSTIEVPPIGLEHYRLKKSL